MGLDDQMRQERWVQWLEGLLFRRGGLRRSCQPQSGGGIVSPLQGAVSTSAQRNFQSGFEDKDLAEMKAGYVGPSALTSGRASFATL